MHLFLSYEDNLTVKYNTYVLYSGLYILKCWQVYILISLTDQLAFNPQKYLSC